MPVYNAMPYLPEAIESILVQTHSDFTFIIGDDGSSDGSLECIKSYAQRDKRITIMQHSERLGPSRSSNWVANAAKTELVARMDADDIANPNRLLREIQAMQKFSDAVLVGSLFETIDANGNVFRPRSRWHLRLQRLPPVAHTSIMYRNAVFKSVRGYSEDCDYFEDQDLYWRMSFRGKLLILPETLCKYRVSGSSVRLNDNRTSVENQLDFYWRQYDGKEEYPITNQNKTD
jgi:glycosyltransferase involved in cell wall biosynthesis